MSKEGYKKSVTYTFEVSGEIWEVVDWREEYMAISETRKNGQEDTHCHLELYCSPTDRVWKMEEYCREQLDTYWSADTADKILEHVNKYGMPKDEL